MRITTLNVTKLRRYGNKSGTICVNSLQVEWTMEQGTRFVPIDFFSRRYFFKKYFSNHVTMPTMPTMLYYCCFKPFLDTFFVTKSCYSMLQSIKKPVRARKKSLFEKKVPRKKVYGVVFSCYA